MSSRAGSKVQYNTNSCLEKWCSMTITQFIDIQNYTRKLEKSVFTMLVLKLDNFEKFTIGGNAFQTKLEKIREVDFY